MYSGMGKVGTEGTGKAERDDRPFSPRFRKVNAPNRASKKAENTLRNGDDRKRSTPARVPDVYPDPHIRIDDPVSLLS
jgi:hypothetical protein